MGKNKTKQNKTKQKTKTKRGAPLLGLAKSIYCNFVLGSFHWGGGVGGREQTPCINWWNPNGYGFKALLV